MSQFVDQQVDPIANPGVFGISEQMLIRLHEPATYRHQPYLDLITDSLSSDDSEVLPDAVVEANGRAALYLIADNPSRNFHASPEKLIALREMLACRGDARYLGVIAPGVLDIYPIGFYGKKSPGTICTIQLQPGDSLHEFLIGTGDRRASSDATWLDNYLLGLLQATARGLKATQCLTDSQVLSLVGRGLFMRFIGDRHIIENCDVTQISQYASSLEGLLSSAEAVADTFSWLDTTFNGNLLPLLETNEHSAAAYRTFFSSMGTDAAQAICYQLGNIMAHALDGQLHLGWQKIRFEHVPADTLSQVYEHFAHVYWKEYAKRTSIHYTPRHVAQILIESAFSGLGDGDVSSATVLDPAAGVGVFLVLAFKRLVQENWKATGKRPQRKTIRDILENQLCGFDINAESLKFAALSLYLTALELDPSPTPLSELKFNELDKAGTLVNVGQSDLSRFSHGDALPIELGSLSASLPRVIQRRFDIVIGNPPWTKLKSSAIPLLTTLIRGIAKKQGVTDDLVNRLKAEKGQPDIPFVWRAMEWAKPNGMIAYALHAQHLLFQQGHSAVMRQALLGCLEVTGILNGSAIRTTRVWPNVDAPFCFLVARNAKPSDDSAFYFLSPVLEATMNREGGIRLDPHAALPVSQSLARNSPHLFKTLFRGASLDYTIVQRIFEHPAAIPLAAYWREQGLANGKGFRPTDKTEINTAYLGGYKMLEASDKVALEVNAEHLQEFNYSYIHRRCQPEIFDAPLLLLSESPKPDRLTRGGLISWQSIAYSESFIGYSAARHPEGDVLVRYLQLLSCSDIFLFILLMTSSKFGVERDSILKEDIDEFPVIPLEKLNDAQKMQVNGLSRSLIAGGSPWNEIDAFVVDLYSLTSADLQVIRDTLAISLPFHETQKFAGGPPDQATLEDFVAELQQIVSPFAKKAGMEFQVKPEASLDASGWRFIRIVLSTTTEAISDDFAIVDFLHGLAEQFWASQVRFHGEADGSFLVGQLAQNRYWTKTRARLLALDLLNTGFITPAASGGETRH